jgi:hypothetical protein
MIVYHTWDYGTEAVHWMEADHYRNAAFYGQRLGTQ